MRTINPRIDNEMFNGYHCTQYIYRVQRRYPYLVYVNSYLLSGLLRFWRLNWVDIIGESG